VNKHLSADAVRWLHGKPIYVDGFQIAEILRSAGHYIIRNLRPNGTTGVCYTANTKDELRNWLDSNYPGWSQEK
jgi:hypothetical protein